MHIASFFHELLIFTFNFCDSAREESSVKEKEIFKFDFLTEQFFWLHAILHFSFAFRYQQIDFDCFWHE